MKVKVGLNFENQNVEIVLARVDTAIQIYDAFAVPLGIGNIFGNLSIDEEKQLIKVAGIIKSTLKTKKISDAELFTVIPDEYCSIRILRLPLVSEKEILSAIELQAEEFIPYPVEEANFDYQILVTDEKEREMSVLVVATYKKFVERLSAFILDCGLYPTSLEPQTTAIMRMFFNGNFINHGDLIITANVGEKATQTTILDLKNKQILMSHDFSLGVHFFTKALQSNMNIPLEDAEKQLYALKIDSEPYKKIIAPLFLEYSKEIQKILVASTEKIGLMPKALYVHAVGNSDIMTELFKNSSLLINSNTFSISPGIFDMKSTLKFAPEIDKSKLTPFVSAMAALT